MANVEQTYTLKVVTQGLGEVTTQLKQLNKNLGAVPSAQEKVNKSTKKAKDLNDNYQTGLKGVIGATSNSTKAFSKMSEGMVGNLVPAYATVAANVFALTAAFGALERAADLEVLTRASEKLAETTGRSLQGLAKNMQKITGGAISMKQALTQASLAASAGFDSSTIEALTAAATNASRALGTDMADSMDRIFRGAIKAEPELLDELGIILRLEPATKKYAVSLGKTAKELTTFEKQQAIVNEVLSQTTEKFGSLEASDPNPYTKLSAAMQDVVASFLAFVNLPLGGIAAFLADNVFVLGTVMALLARNVVSLATPALEALSKTAAGFGETIDDVAIRLEGFAQTTLSGQNQQVLSTGTKALIDYEKAIVKVADSNKAAKKTFATLTSTTATSSEKVNAAILSINNMRDKLVNKGPVKGLDLGTDDLTEQLLVLNRIETDLKAQQVELKKTSKVTNSWVRGGVKGLGDLADSLTQAGNATKKTYSNINKADGYVNTFKATIKSLNISLSAAELQLTKFNQATILLGRGVGTAVGAVAGLAGKLLKNLPTFVGVTVAIETLTGVMHALGATDLKAPMKDQEEALETTAKSIAKYTSEVSKLPDTLDNINKKLEFQANVLSAITDSMNTAREAISKEGGFDFIDRALSAFNLGSFEIFRENLDEISSQLSKLGYDQEVLALTAKYGTIQSQNRDEAAKFQKELENLGKVVKNNIQGAKAGAKAYSDLFDSLSKGLIGISGELPKLTNTQKSLIDIQGILAGAKSKGASGLLSGLERLSAIELKTLGLDTVIADASKYLSELEAIGKERNSLEEKLKAVSIGLYSNYGTNEDKIRSINKQLEENADKALTAQKAQQELSKKAEEALAKVVDRTKELISANEDLNRTKQQISIEKLYGTSDLVDRIALTDKLSEAQLKYFRIQAKDDPKLLSDANAAVKEQAAEVSNLTNLVLALNNLKIQPDTNVLKTDIDAVETDLADAQAKLAEANKQSTQIGLRNAKNRIDQGEVLKKQLIDTVKELEKFKKFGNQDIFKDAIKFLEDRLPIIAKELQKVFGDGFKIDVDKIAREAKEARDRVASFTGTGYASSGNVETDRFNQVAANNTSLDQIASLGAELTINEQLNGVLDKRVDKQFILRDLQLKAALAAETDLDNQAEIQKAILLNDAQRLLVIEKQNIALNKQAKRRLQDVAATSKLAKQELARNRAMEGFVGDPKELEDLIKQLEQIDSLINSMDLAKVFTDAAGAMNSMASAMQNVNDAMQETPLEQQAAGIKLLQTIGDDIGGSAGKAAKGIATLSASIGAYNAQLQANKEKEAADKQNKFNRELADTQAMYSALSNSASALAGIFDEGSTAAKAFTIIAQGAAIASAAGAVAEAAKLPPPAGFASAAAMLSLMTSVLGAAGIAFGKGESTNTSATDNYKAQFNDQGIAGINTDAANDGLRKSVNILSDVNADLFSATYDLKIAVNSLENSFSRLGVSLNKVRLDGGINPTLAPDSSRNTAIGDFAVVAGTFAGGVLGNIFGGPVWAGIGASIGATLGTAISSFFGSTKVSEKVLDKGIEFSLAVEEVGGEIVAALDNASLYATIEKKTKKKKYFGLSSSTKTSIRKELEPLGAELASMLVNTFSDSIDAAVQGVSILAENAGADMDALVSGLSITSGENPLLFSTESQSDAEASALAISNLFTTMTDETISQLLPHVEDFRLAGEDLTSTLMGLIATSANVSSSLASVGLDNLALDNFDESSIISKYKNNVKESAENLRLTLGYTIAQNFVKEALDPASIDKYVAQQKVAINDYWNRALENSFGGADEFNQAFKEFSTSIFSEAELADIALANAEQSVQTGLQAIIEQANSLGMSDLASIIDLSAPTESLRAFFDAANEQDAFASVQVFDDAGEVIGDLGQQLLTTTVSTGVAISAVNQAIEGLNTELDDLNKKYERQIAVFGLFGKELELLQLDFDFQDAKEEALKITDDLTLVETAFGLERLSIIKKYNEEITDSLTTAFSGVSDSIISISKSFDAWDDVAFQTARINKLSKVLGKSLSGVDLSVLELDSTSVQDFMSNFGEMLNITTTSPESITEQIALVEDLRVAIVDRYNLEANAIEELNDGLGTLSVSIRDFLDNILVSDISPLTNIERLNEAQNQFTDNLNDVLSNDATVSERAQSNLLTSANTLLEQASEFYAIGPQFNAIFTDVTTKLKELGVDINAQVSTNEERIVTATENLASSAISQLETLDKVLLELQSKQQDEFESDVVYAMQNTLPSAITGITKKLAEIDQSSWTPIKNALTNLGSFAVGTNSVAYDQLALIHKGEAIIPQKDAEALRNGSVSSNTQFVAPDNTDVVNAIKTLTQVLVDTQVDLLEQGEKIEKAAGESIKIGVPATTKGLV